MMQSPPALPSADGPQNWGAIRTEVSVAWIFVIPILLLVICSGAFMVVLGRGERDPWLSLLALGSGAFMVIGAIWRTLWIFLHGSFNFDINQKTKRIRKWKTSFFLRRSFDEYAYGDFCAVRSVERFENGGVYWVMVELLFKTTKPALEVGRFSAVASGASCWHRCVNTLRGVYAEGPKGVALRHELVKLMDIKDAGYFEREQ